MEDYELVENGQTSHLFVLLLLSVEERSLRLREYVRIVGSGDDDSC